MNAKNEELQFRTSSIRLLRDIAVAANEAKEPEQAFQYALEKICQFGDWSLAHVYWRDQERPDRLISTELWFGEDSGRYQHFRTLTRQMDFKKGVGLPGQVLEKGAPYVIQDMLSELIQFRAEEAKETGLRSAFALPVMVGAEVVAVIEFFSPKTHELDEDTIDLMAQVGTQLGRVIERKRSEEQIRSQAARLRAMVEISRMLAEAETDIQKVLNAVAKQVTELVGDTCTIALISPDGQNLQAVAYYHSDPLAMQYLTEMTRVSRRIDEGLLGEVLQSGQGLILNHLSREEQRTRFLPHYLPYIERFGIYALLIVPLRVQGKSIGTLSVSRDSPHASYTSEDQEFLQELADRAALAINNAQLFDALQRELSERKQVQAELTELQRLMMDSVDLERLRLAKKLHDDAIQGLYGVIFTLESVREDVKGESSKTQIRLVTRELQQVINRLQGTFKELQPPTLVPFGLDQAIGAFIESFVTEKPEYRIRLDLQPDIKLSERVGYTLFRIFHQTIENIVQHAGANEIDISLSQVDNRVILEIQDNGAGFAPPKRWIDLVRKGRYGLARQSERAAAIGGLLSVESQPGEGTRVRISAPLSEES